MKSLSMLQFLWYGVFCLCAVCAILGFCYYAQITAAAQQVPVTSTVAKPHEESIYDFELPGIDGTTIKLSDFKGKVLFIVNTAAKCSFAPQYKDLELLHQKYKAQGLVIIGVSSDDFSQEIKNEAERVCYLEDNFPTTFLMTDTVHVIDRKGAYEACPLYKWLNEHGAQKSWFNTGAVQWNFHKFLIGKDGEFIDWFATTTAPNKKRVMKAIEKALAP